MGMALFESSGTFKPSDYGLSPGDLIHVIAVGGGGGGSYGSNAGSAGSASSFGNILTAAGGSAGSTSDPPSINTIAGRNNPVRGYQHYAKYYVPTNNSSAQNIIQIMVGSQGADGWLPGRPFKTNPSYPHRFFLNDLPYTTYFQTSNSNIQGATSLTDEHIWNVGGYTGNSTQLAPLNAAQMVPMAGYGGSYTNNNSNSGQMRVYLGGAGGIGYGAGGGGSHNYFSSYALNGGYSGVKADIDYVLQSMDAVAVTVGNGGAGYRSGNDGGGGGSRGCVAVFW